MQQFSGRFDQVNKIFAYYFSILQSICMILVLLNIVVGCLVLCVYVICLKTGMHEKFKCGDSRSSILIPTHFVIPHPD